MDGFYLVVVDYSFQMFFFFFSSIGYYIIQNFHRYKLFSFNPIFVKFFKSVITMIIMISFYHLPNTTFFHVILTAITNQIQHYLYFAAKELRLRLYSRSQELVPSCCATQFWRVKNELGSFPCSGIDYMEQQISSLKE